jgi:hypothetical protein
MFVSPADRLLSSNGTRDRAGQELVDHLARQQAADVVRHAVKHPRRGAPIRIGRYGVR